MEDFIKNIIENKKYFELTSSEQQSIKEWASNEEEFDALKTVLQASNEAVKNFEVIPSHTVKQRLDNRFAAKHAYRNEEKWGRFLIFLFPKNTFFYKKPAFQLVMVALIVALIIPFLWQNKPAQYAMNEDQRKLEVEKVQKKVDEENDSSMDIAQSPVQDDNKIVKEHKEVLSEQPAIPIDSDFYLEGNMSLDSSEEMEGFVERSVPHRAMTSKKTEDLTLSKSKSKVETAETIALLTALY